MLRILDATDGFEVTWDDPADAEQHWQLDREHQHGVMTRFELDAANRMFEVAMSMPGVAVNGRLYSSMANVKFPAPPREARGRHFSELWSDIYRPAAVAAAREIIDGDYEAMGEAELAAALPALIERSAEGFLATQTPVFTLFLALVPFAEFCKQHLEEAEALALQSAMLQGHPSETTEIARTMERLAVEALPDGELLDGLERGEHEALRGAGAHAAFFGQFDALIERCGWRAALWSDLSTPTGAEDPAVPLAMIVRYARTPEARPSVALERSAAQRVAAIEQVRLGLPDDAARSELAEHLERCEPSVAVREERAHWQLMLVGSLRRPLMELGRRLTERGTLERPEDVLHFEGEELAALEAGAIDGPAEVARRRSDLDHWRTLEAPDFIGVPDDGPSGMLAALGLDIEPPEQRVSADGRVVSGVPAGGGVAYGRARVVYNLEEALLLEPGEVLVTQTTAPPWTALFAVASAVVTEGGGLQSHSAIVAREYGIPCVVGTRVATSAIPNGAMVTVDGRAGTIRID